MLSMLRFVGLMNAAIWFGGCVFFSFAAAPAIFQPEMKRLFQDYWTGVVAQFMQERYFSFQLICGAVALAHTLVSWWAGRRERTLVVPVLLAVLYAVTLAGTFWFQPRLKALYKAKHWAATPTERQQAAAAFGAWHGAAQGLNLLMIGGLAFYLFRSASAFRNASSLPGTPGTQGPSRLGFGWGNP